MDDPGDKALVAALCYGTVRWWPRLDAVLSLMLERPLKPADDDVRALVLLGLFQLQAMRVPPHAAVAATVEAARLLKKPWAARLVNALLRRFQREETTLLAGADANDSGKWAHPAWLVEAVRRDWPEDWEAILEAANREPPMWLRVNLDRIGRAEYALQLAAAGSEPDLAPAWAPAALRLPRALDVAALPGFARGLVSVQDAAAQLAAEMLAAEPRMRVLDACAAPGGKTGHLLERAGGQLELTALDVDARRLERVEENLARLGYHAQLVAADAAQTDRWWRGLPFDRILVDAPCSATGVIRRHPDIKLLRRTSDIANLAISQTRLLDALWPLLCRGGRLVYCTCSLLKTENERVIAAFVDRHRDARVLLPEATGAPWRVCGAGVQLLPCDADVDGFYYARLEKR